jgi:hypothetical protein
MRKLLNLATGGVAIFIRVSVCIVSVAMLLSFPANSSHHFDQHFGSTQIRRSIVRHTFVDGPKDNGAEEIARIDLEPTIPVPVIIESAAKPLATFELSSEVSPIRLLQRFKLGRSRSGGPDPLL